MYVYSVFGDLEEFVVLFNFVLVLCSQKLVVEGSDDCGLYHIQDFWAYGRGKPPNIAENNAVIRKLVFFFLRVKGLRSIC